MLGMELIKGKDLMALFGSLELSSRMMELLGNTNKLEAIAKASGLKTCPEDMKALREFVVKIFAPSI